MKIAACGPRSTARAAEPGGLAAAYDELARLDPSAAARIDPNNERRIVRALEVIRITGKPFSSFGAGVGACGATMFPVRLAGVWLPRTVLARRIAARIGAMRDVGLVEEVEALVRRHGARVSRTARQAIGYNEIIGVLEGQISSVDDAFERALRRTATFARRQRMWFRRDPRIEWFGTPENPAAMTAGASAIVVAMSPIELSKLHATGNDFLVQLASERVPALDARAACSVCDRHRGIGADGLISVEPGRDGADCVMVLRNADGGLAEMTGNGIRCLAWVAHRAGLGDGERLVVDTAAGRRTVDLETSAGTVTAATCRHGPGDLRACRHSRSRAEPVRARGHLPRHHLRGRRRGHG